jgi:peptidoglycan/LPS O-acetylase OafA/YrhL
MTPMTPEEASHQLVTADALATTSGTDVRIGAFTTAGVGVLVAAFLVLSTLFAETNPMAFAIGVIVYVLALGALMTWHNRQVRVAKRGWNRRHFASFVITMVLYGIGIGWSTSGSPSWALFAPYCALVALPMLVAAGRSARR